LTALFGIPLLAGFILMIVWVGATAVAATVEGWEGVDPDRRYGRTGRFIVAGTIGFGMAGMSALYGGWPHLLAIGAGVLGAGGLIGVSVWLGPETED
jgi:hypothetical protein